MKREFPFLFAILLVATALRLPGFGDSLWFDEVYYTDAYFADPVKKRFLLAWEDIHPPLYAFLMLAWTRIFGDSEIAVRIPSLMAGLGSLVVLWRIALAWMGPGPARLVALLVAVSPPHIWYSRETKVNMLVVLLTTAAVWWLWSAAEGGGKRAWVLGSLATLAALFTHAYALPVAAALAGWLVWRSFRQPALRRPAVTAQLLVAFVWLPPALIKLLSWGQNMERDYLRDFTLAEAYKLLLSWFPHGNTIRTLGTRALWSQLSAQPLALFFVDLFVALVLLRGVGLQVRLARGHDSRAWTARLLLMWFLGPLVLAWTISQVVGRGYVERSLLVALPPFLLLLASGASGRYGTILRAGLVSVGCTGFFLLVYGKPHARTILKPKPDWRSAALWLASQSGRLDLFVTCPTNELTYYVLPRPTLLHEIREKSVVLEARQAGWCPPSPLYLIHNLTWDGAWNEVWPQFWRDPRLSLVEVKRFFGLEIYKFVQVSNAAPKAATLDLGGRGQSLLCASGFHDGEAAQGQTFVWSSGPLSRLVFPLSPENRNYRLLVRARRVDGLSQVHVRFRLNGHPLGELTWSDPGFQTLELPVARECLEQGENTLEIEYAEQFMLSPQDARTGSLCFDRIDLRPW